MATEHYLPHVRKRVDLPFVDAAEALLFASSHLSPRLFEFLQEV
jgi:hypothetical protein